MYQTDNGYPVPEIERERRMTRTLSGVFGWMFLGLAISGVCAWIVPEVQFIDDFLYSTEYGFFALLIIELVLVIVFSARIGKMSSVSAVCMFFLYAVVNGLTLSVIFYAYELGTIYGAFLGTAGMFGVMAIYGAVTKRKLTSFGSFLIMALFGLILVSFINIFLGNDTFDTIICYAGILIFVGLTAYDTQRIKKMVDASPDSETVRKVQIMGALTLYLDFINIFLKLLRLMGKRSR